MSALERETILTVLQHGEINIKGKFLWGSNYTFLTEVTHAQLTLPAVYKPVRGERPLWDFPAASLSHREVAAYLVSQALGWEMVPETQYRRKAPLGPGSLQLFIEHDPEYHYFNMEAEDRQRLRPVVLFDLLINNADRKGGHILFDENHKLWLIDHGICFHVEDKLRTVIWDFAGERIPAELLSAIRELRLRLDPPSELVETLNKHLKLSEIRAISRRAERLLDEKVFPGPHPNRRPYPWPPV